MASHCAAAPAPAAARVAPEGAALTTGAGPDERRTPALRPGRSDGDVAEGDATSGSANSIAAPARLKLDSLELIPLVNGVAPADTQPTSEQIPGTRCGIGRWKPDWLQRLASKKAYILLHGLIGLHQIAMGAYFVATISTLEKRFKFSSKTSGLISSAWEIGACCSLLIMGYLGKSGHKPRYVAFGMFLMSLSCLTRLLPHLLYGAGQDALDLTEEYGRRERLDNLTTGAARENKDLCGSAGDPGQEDCSDGGSWGPPSIILFMSGIILGVGSSVFWTLGMAYLDDNTEKKKAPLALAASICIRMVGPTVGFALASYALAQYVDMSATPLIEPSDPRWIGAWWFGYVPATILGVVLAALMLLFPRQLPRAAQRRARRARSADSAPPPERSVKDFVSGMRRMLRNKLLVYNTFSGVCYLFGLVAYWTFMPKYMETQYRQSASKASLISGSVGLVFTGVGVIASAVVISKFQPRARTLAAWSVAVEAVDVAGHFSWAFLSCGEQDLHGGAGGDGAWNLTAACNAACGCGPHVKYEPVCSPAAAATFYSPCHAGCGLAQALANGTSMYTGCACSPDGVVVQGACPRDCAFNFGLFITMQCLMALLGSSGLAGNTLIQFRCVHEDDKSLALAIGEFLVCALAFIPGPIIYGALLDSACLVWGESCGQTGNCWLYDDKSLRYLLNFTAVAWLFLGMMLDIGVWYHCKDLQMYDEEDSKKGTKDLHKRENEDEVPFLAPSEKAS